MASPNLEGLSIHEEEEEGFALDFEEEGDEQVNLKWCLIGRFLCERPIHFKSMKVRMADLWRPVKGVTIKEARAGLFLFSFAHPLDMEAVLNGGPWTFDNNMLLLERVQLGMQIESIPLFYTDFWVQIHNLPAGLMKEMVGVKLGSYIGTFMEYDKNNNTSFWRQYMRVRVKVDVRQPLKKDTKVKDREGNWCTVNFKYEKLGVFCFVCGIMGHAENKCEIRFSMENDDGRREWSGELRADQRRGGGRQSSRWLREEKDGGEGLFGGARRSQGGPTTDFSNVGCTPADVSDTVLNQTHHNQIALNSNNSSSIIMLNGPLHKAESSTTNQLTLSINQPETDKANHSSRQPLLFAETDKTKQSLGNQFPLISSLPPFNCQSIPFPSPPSHQLFPNNHINIPLLPNNTLTFTSQPKLTTPLKQSNRKQLSIHRIKSTKYPAQPEPILTQIQINPNPAELTQSLNRTGSEPNTPNPNQNSTVDMDTQTERKRRREERNQTEKNDEETSQHFLSVGPGSQDCREQ
jgi:14-3-3 protein epsilon